MTTRYTAKQLARAVGARVQGDGEVMLTGCATLDEAGAQDVSFLANPRYAHRLQTTAAGAVLVGEDYARGLDRLTALVAEDPYFAFREAMVKLLGFRETPAPKIDDKAVVHRTATLGEGCYVGPFAVIGPGAVIGSRCVIYSHVAVGPRVRIGEDCQLFPQVTIYDDCVLGARVTLHAGTVIGQDGFGYATHAAPGRAPAHHKIPQAGHAVIGDDVEMGANCCVDRATLGATVIARGTKFSDAVAIGHGTKVGPHNLYVAQVGLAGSVTTGSYVALGGQVGVAGHLTVHDRARVAATSGVMHDVPADTEFAGAPAVPIKSFMRSHLHTQKLPELAASVKRLQRRIDQLEKQLADRQAPGDPR